MVRKTKDYADMIKMGQHLTGGQKNSLKHELSKNKKVFEALEISKTPDSNETIVG